MGHETEASASASLDGLPRPGDLIDGKYRVLEVLGVGGMGAVLAGEHVRLDQPVAIKVLLPWVAKFPGALDRFLREARAAARIRGEHAVRILDVTTTAEGMPYMVMERLIGCDLAALSARGTLPVARAVGYVSQAIEAVAEAHAAGIIHRDLKPGNLFLAQRADGSSVVKVLDFGVSKQIVASGSGVQSLTAPNTLVGSPQYMSPEQVRDGGGVDARADVWALGVILYELITGALPFNGKTPMHVFALILTEAPRPPRALRPEVPEGLERVILRCLEKDVTSRVPDVRELARLLAPFTGVDEEAPARSVVVTSPPLSSAEAEVSGVAETVMTPAPQGRSRRWFLYGAILAAAAAGAALAISAATVWSARSSARAAGDRPLLAATPSATPPAPAPSGPANAGAANAGAANTGAANTGAANTGAANTGAPVPSPSASPSPRAPRAGASSASPSSPATPSSPSSPATAPARVRDLGGIRPLD